MAKHLHSCGFDLDDVAAISPQLAETRVQKRQREKWDAEGGNNATGK